MAFAEEVEDSVQVLPALLQGVLSPVHRVHVRQLLPLLHLLERETKYKICLVGDISSIRPLCQLQGQVDFPNLLAQGLARKSG